MRDHKDQVTAEIPGVKPLPKPRERKYANDAEKQAAYRARNHLVMRTISIPAEVDEALQAALKKSGKGISETVVKLLRTQLLRKR
ncbi:hypothetical protein GTP45_10720 [Pseudoduganella sp. FT55W]|uniref:LexA regulated protein n=1 Tax=Duganella rivi TaxID=2666083 RepID=A0A7X4GPL6_9BURK|nr:hypothetical protein [Duganella rivi]MYM67303.1 hypothetical protein [Duganella rivi]